jgi:HEAT repeat protein
MTPLNSLLVRDGVVSARAIQEALERQVIAGGDIGTALLEIGALPENVLASYAASVLELPVASVDDVMSPPREALDALPPTLLIAHRVVPFALENGALVVAVSAPLGLEVEEKLVGALGYPIAQRIVCEVRIAAALAHHFEAPLSPRFSRLLRRMQGRDVGQTSSVAPPPVSRSVSGFPRPVARRDSEAAPRSSAPEASRPTLPAPVGPLVPSVLPSAAPSIAPALDASTLESVAPSERPPPRAQTSPPAPRAETSPSSAPRPPSQAPSLSRGSSPPGLTRPELDATPASRRSYSGALKVLRGPITFAASERLLAGASGRDQVLEVLLSFARQFFDYAAVFSVQDGVATGREAWGVGPPNDELRTLRLPLELPGLLGDACRTRAPQVRALGLLEADAELAAALGRSGDATAFALPVTLRQRAVLVLYGDRGGEPFELDMVMELVRFGPRIAEALERIILLRKRASEVVPTEEPRARVAVEQSAPRAPAPTPAETASESVEAEATGESAAARGTSGSAPAVAAGEQAEAAEGGQTIPPSRAVTAGESVEPAPEVESVSAHGAPDEQAHDGLEPDGAREPGAGLAERASESVAAETPGDTDADAGTATPPSVTESLDWGDDHLDFDGAFGPWDSPSEGMELSLEVGFDEPSAGSPSVRQAGGDASDQPRGAAVASVVVMPAVVLRPVVVPARPDALASAAGPDGEDEPELVVEVSRGASELAAERDVAFEDGGTAAASGVAASSPPPREELARGSQPASAPAVAVAAAPRPMVDSADEWGEGTVDEIDEALMRPSLTGLPRFAAASGEGPSAPSAPSSVTNSAPPRLLASLEVTSRYAEGEPHAEGQPLDRSELPRMDRPSTPSIIVDMGPQVGERVEALRDAGTEAERDAAILALVEVGEEALPALVQAFPGRLSWDRNRSPDPQGRDVSSVARAILAFGPRAVPYVATLLGSSSSEVRHCAALLAADLVDPALLGPLAGCLHDPDPLVRRLACSLLPRFGGFRELTELRVALRRTARLKSAPAERRGQAVDALAAVRDVNSVESLIELLREADERLLDRAQRALIVLTGEDLGASHRRWAAWFEKHREEHRVEWLIAGLLHSEERVRVIACAELERLTQERFGFRADAAKKERERAHAAYVSWWESEGRARFE